MRIPAKNVMPRKHTRGRSPPTVPVIIKLTFVGFSADAGTAAVGVFFVNCGRMFADCALERVDASGLSFILF